MNTQEQLNNLNEKIDKLNLKMNAIYEILKSNQSNNTQSISKIDKPTKINNSSQSTLSNKLIPKSDLDWDGMIDTISDTKDKNILSSIFQNKYPTITSGQFKLISDIVSKHGLTL